ncbi:MAG TPA: TIGR03667 family PPOX class F420-dependent oxidoreductase [Ktedonobacteraceae bacterium]|nr:TIGR03667 family PPOX class F420-dependent oxidoreductase [Ktedonobacteraceae bacterium]
MAFQLPDPSTPFGERVARRLRDDVVIWLTTVDEEGTPQPTPVWFLWDEASAEFLIYSLSNAKRLQHLQHDARVSLNFDGNGTGGDIIVFTGQAHFSPDELPANQVQGYIEKYRNFISRSFGTPENFASRYSVALRVLPSAVRGH